MAFGALAVCQTLLSYPYVISSVCARSVASNSLWPHGLQPTRHLCSWDSPGKKTGVGCYSLHQSIFPTQGLNPGLLSCRQLLYCLSPADINWKAETQFSLVETKRNTLKKGFSEL